MAVPFLVLDKDLRATLDTLHDLLWMGRGVDVPALRKDLVEAGRRMEGFLGRTSRFSAVMRPMATALDRKSPSGEALYGLLSNFWHLTAATEHFSKKRYSRAAARCFEAVDGPWIGFASGLGHHDWVDARRSGRITQEEYLRRVADGLEARGARNAGQLKRLAATVAAIKDGLAAKTLPDPAVAARTAVLTTALFLGLYPQVMRELGWYQDLPLKDYPRLAGFIASRV